MPGRSPPDARGASPMEVGALIAPRPECTTATRLRAGEYSDPRCHGEGFAPRLGLRQLVQLAVNRD